MRDDRVPRVFLSVSVTAAAQRSGGAGEKDEKRQLDEEEELLVKRKFRKLRSEEAKGEREREKEQRVSIIPQQVQSVLLVFSLNI